jgi:hypothetical protein
MPKQKKMPKKEDKPAQEAASIKVSPEAMALLREHKRTTLIPIGAFVDKLIKDKLGKK